jgi:short-subunit dehydrogenase involved in D-alanine esterification of teichoic acids
MFVSLLTLPRITAAYPKLDSIILNAGFQRTMNFTNPASISIESATSELHTNYLSPLATIAAFLPHLASLSTPASIYLVSSGLALMPIDRCPNYCASKAALHSLAWTLRSQLDAPETKHVRVVEILPPAVQTELHSQQADLVAVGDGHFGMPLDAFTDETWDLMRSEDNLDEIMVSEVRKNFEHMEDQKRETFRSVMQRMKAGGGTFKGVGVKS